MNKVGTSKITNSRINEQLNKTSIQYTVMPGEKWENIKTVLKNTTEYKTEIPTVVNR